MVAGAPSSLCGVRRLQGRSRPVPDCPDDRSRTGAHRQGLATSTSAREDRRMNGRCYLDRRPRPEQFRTRVTSRFHQELLPVGGDPSGWSRHGLVKGMMQRGCEARPLHIFVCSVVPKPILSWLEASNDGVTRGSRVARSRAGWVSCRNIQYGRTPHTVVGAATNPPTRDTPCNRSRLVEPLDRSNSSWLHLPVRPGQRYGKQPGRSRTTAAPGSRGTGRAGAEDGPDLRLS